MFQEPRDSGGHDLDSSFHWYQFRFLDVLLGFEIGSRDSLVMVFNRQVTFCKRRNGLMEKARQFSILCRSSVAVLIVSSTGKFYSSYCEVTDFMKEEKKRKQREAVAEDLSERAFQSGSPESREGSLLYLQMGWWKA
ncbi:hypothetical protein Rs2_40819 [Raphanus sativus]|nr:hypothetical protein Rs2_40819 [Raphanus sativus]